MKLRYPIILSVALFSIWGCQTKKAPESPPAEQTPSTVPVSEKAKLPLNTVRHASANPKVSYKTVNFNSLPDWHHQHFEESLRSFQKGCQKLKTSPKWAYVCTLAEQVEPDRGAVEKFFSQHFQAWQVSNDQGTLVGKVTGYFEPLIEGSLTQNYTYPLPIYGRPSDLVSIPLPPYYRTHPTSVSIKKSGASYEITADGPYTADLREFNIAPHIETLKGRFVGNRFVPYYSRSEIEAGALVQTAPVLAYTNDPLALFFLHVQGSGKLLNKDTHEILTLNYTDKNGLPYRSIAQYMAKKGYLQLDKANPQSIRNYVQHHLHKLPEILGANPSYIFFNIGKNHPNEGPIGTLGVPLTKEYSGAIDKQYIDLGAPLFVSTTDTRTKQALNRLIIGQDTGSAIKGSVRVDFFWGYGPEAEKAAGRTNYPGYVWLLLPNGEVPL